MSVRVVLLLSAILVAIQSKKCRVECNESNMLVVEGAELDPYSLTQRLHALESKAAANRAMMSRASSLIQQHNVILAQQTVGFVVVFFMIDPLDASCLPRQYPFIDFGMIIT
jgi:hypothetical protein